MKITLESTGRLGIVDGQPARLWTGTTTDGCPVHAWIAFISPQTHDPALLAAFDRELPLRNPVPAITEVIDARFIL